jgi:ankyrin repeat protein
MNLPPPPQGDNPIITQFKPAWGQWELNDGNIQRIDPETGQTILHNYCKYINTTPLEVYKHLIETLGADINVQDKDKNTPLHYALIHFTPNEDDGNTTVLMYLLGQRDVNVNIKGKYGVTLLHTACNNINTIPLDVFKLVVETHGADLNAQDDFHETPIHRAVCYFSPNHGGDFTTLMYFLTHKNVHVNVKGRDGSTLLHSACANINDLSLDVFKLLVERKGFDVNAQDDDKDTPIHVALHYFNPDDGGDITILTYLVSQEGVNVNVKGEDGYTLLHTACYNLNFLPLDIFKLLIKTQGCDVNIQDDDGNTPLYIAFRQFNGRALAVLSYLLSQESVNVNIKSPIGCTLLHEACICNITESDDALNSDDDLDDANLGDKSDTILSQIVEVIVERCVQQVLDESS